MQNNCTNIYKSARLVAGYTQERAAEMINVSVRSIADYETGVRIPPNDVVNDMVTCYDNQMLGIKHLQQFSRAARDLLPEVREMCLQEATLSLVNAIYKFAANETMRELMDIAQDGKVDKSEEMRFDKVLDELAPIVSAAMALRCSRAVEEVY